jgi:penicillin-binding protein 1A
LISVFAVIVFFYYGTSLPSEMTLLVYSPPTTTKIYSEDNELMEEYAVERRIFIPFDKIPVVIKGAFLAAEDRNFYEHSGISLKSLMRAIIENTVRKSWNKKPVGGSTITQQIAKNLLVGNKRSLNRKIREAIMAFRIESTISKDKIFEIYLNQLYLGKGCYGIVEACNYYFGKQIDKISPQEAAFLASIPSAPSVYINCKNIEKVLNKRNSILYQMHELGYISNEELKQSVSSPIDIKFKKCKIFAKYFSDEVFKLISQIVSVNSFLKCGYQIKTTMNKSIQEFATRALENGLISYTKTRPYFKPTYSKKDLKYIDMQLPSTINKVISAIVVTVKDKLLICKDSIGQVIKVVYSDANLKKDDVVLCRLLDDSKTYELYQQPKVTGGIVVMDLDNGDILGMSGGYSFYLSSFNCITQAQRQPGSTIKPFIYATAIEEGWDEDDIIEDNSINISLPNGEKYTPHNYNKSCWGDITLRRGLIYSRNLATVDLARQVGMKPISKMLKDAGLIKDKIPISAVLGSIETTPLKLLSAFSSFFNKGIMVLPRFIKTINGSEECYLCLNKKRNIMSEKTAECIKGMLHDIVRFGTAQNISNLEKELGIEIFGKTGTTNDFKDAWFIGAFTKSKKRYLVCVFVGNSIPSSLGENMSGSQVALPIFANFVKLMFKE